MERVASEARLVRVPIHRPIKFPQMRRRVDETQIEELAHTIVDCGQLQPGILAKYTSRALMLGHLKMIRDRVYVPVDEPPPAPDGTYSVTVAGHRRLKALQYLWAHACLNCRAMRRSGPSCWQAHVDEGRLKYNRHRQPVMAFNLFVDPDPEEMIRMQLAENTHVQPDAVDAALAYAAQYQYECRRADENGKPRPTVTAFARASGRAYSTIKMAIDFASLPHFMRELVANGIKGKDGKVRHVFPYEGAAAFAPLFALKPAMAEQEARYWCDYGIAKGYTVDEWKALVRARLNDRQQMAFGFAPPVDAGAVHRALVSRRHQTAVNLLGRATDALNAAIATGDAIRVEVATQRVLNRVTRLEVPKTGSQEEILLALRETQRALHDAVARVGGERPAPELVLEAS